MARSVKSEQPVYSGQKARQGEIVLRKPVVNAEKRLVGVISLADAAIKHDPAAVGIAISGVVEPGGLHNSTQPAG